MITNHAPITKLHLTRNSRGSTQFFVETSDGNCYLTRVVNNTAELYHDFYLDIHCSSNSIEDRLCFLNIGPTPSISFSLVGSFDNLEDLANTHPELLL